VIFDVKQRNHIVVSLLKLFPEADGACKDASRMFFGGQKSTVLSRENIALPKLMEVLDINNMTIDGGQTRSLAKSKELNLCRKTGKPLLYNKGIPEILQRSRENSFNLERAIEEVRILNDFAVGKWLRHPQLIGIASNLIWVKGGAKWMKTVMKQFNEQNAGQYLDGEEIQYGEDKFSIIPYVKKHDYYPENLVNFSPYEEDHIHSNIITAVSNTRGHVERIEEIQKIPLKEATEIFETKFEQAINADDNKIYIFRLPTGIGKTKLLTKEDHRALIAVPTHKLKEEIHERIKKEEVRTGRNFDCHMTPELPKFEDEETNKLIEYYYSIGVTDKVHAILNSIAKGNTENGYPDMILASEYLNDVKSLYRKNNQTVITTHKRAVLNKLKHDTLIFDEDPLDSLYAIKSFKIKDLKTLIEGTGSKEIEDVLRFVESSYRGMVNETPQFSFNFERLVEVAIEKKIKTNVLDFFESLSFIKDDDKNVIHYVIKRELPDKKIIILSASAPKEIYKKIYGDRLELVDLTDVEMKGKVIQNTNRSCSRRSLISVLDAIVKKTEHLKVITFAGFKSKFVHPVMNMHFGNCSGYDSLYGEDIAVVGTPHQPQFKYFLLASAIGIDMKGKDTIMVYKKIEWNGHRFMFNTYENLDLRDIQLSLIESDLIQAVGRNRTLRTDATTYLYSNLPLRIVDEFLNEKIEFRNAG